MMSFPSISSQEPPPLHSSSEDEDSEEFRTPGHTLDLLTSAEPSPISTPRKSLKANSISSSSALPENLNGVEQENLNGGEQEGVDQFEQEEYAINQEDKDAVEQEGVDEVEKVEFIAPKQEQKDIIEQEGVVAAVEEKLQFGVLDTVEQKLPETVVDAAKQEDVDGALQEDEDVDRALQKDEDMDGVQQDEDDEDDFGDFATNNFQSAATFPSSQPVDPGGEDEIADFADFQSISSPTTSQPPHFLTSPRLSTDFSAVLASKFDTLIKTVIPSPTEEEPEDEESTIPFTQIEKSLVETKDGCWSHTVDFEESRSLLHKWINSSFQQRLYNSLNIDTSTIVYTEKWGAIEVPRFAAGMVETPILQPQVVTMNSESSLESERRKSLTPQEDTPVILNGTKLSIEAQQIIQKIPDISYMTSKTLVFPQGASSSSTSLL